VAAGAAALALRASPDRPALMDKILVINPNSTEAVTRGIDEACDALRMSGAPLIECVTLKEGPPGIETQRHVDGVVSPLLNLVREKKDYAAYVIACYSDPGLHTLREATKKPVLGISECGILTALTLGQKFGVIAILQKSIPRHLRYMGALGVMDRLAGELPVGLPVVELSNEEKTLKKMIEVGKRLREEHGADVIVMGCAGMARYRKPLQQAVGIPVVEPTQAAVAMAIGRVRLGWESG
jgi:allantoin racemase